MDLQNIDISDEVHNVQHVSGGFICGSALVWPQMIFKYLVGASNSIIHTDVRLWLG